MNDQKEMPVVAESCAVCGGMGYGYSYEGFFRVTCSVKGVSHCEIPPCGDPVTALRVWNAMQSGEDLKDVITRVNMTDVRVPESGADAEGES